MRYRRFDAIYCLHLQDRIICACNLKKASLHSYQITRYCIPEEGLFFIFYQLQHLTFLCRFMRRCLWVIWAPCLRPTPCGFMSMILEGAVSHPTWRTRWLISRSQKQWSYWDFGFESRREHGCLSLVTVVCCQVGACHPSRAQVWSQSLGGSHGPLGAVQPWKNNRLIVKYC